MKTVASELEVEQFKRLCENSTFTYREEIFKGLESGDYILESHNNSEISGQQLLDVYELRAERLSEYQGHHAEQLRNEVLAFCRELKKAPDDSVKFWNISKDKATSFNVFSNSQKILGCVLTVDRRMVSEDDWNKLWNKN